MIEVAECPSEVIPALPALLLSTKTPQKRQYSCSNCKQKGHTKNLCPYPPMERTAVASKQVPPSAEVQAEALVTVTASLSARLRTAANQLDSADTASVVVDLAGVVSAIVKEMKSAKKATKRKAEEISKIIEKV
jgi:hypothetical protein